MKKLIFILMICSFASLAQAELTQKQMKDILIKTVEETLVSSNLNGEYKQTLRYHLESVMYNEQIKNMLQKMINENSVSSIADAEKIGFVVMVGLREKALLTLSNDDLYKLLKLNHDAMSKMTDYECAQYIKKKRTDEDSLGRSLYEILGNLSISSFREYLRYYDKAFANLFSNKTNAIKLNENELLQVKTEFKNLMRELLERNKFVSEFTSTNKSFAESSNSDVCRFGKELLNVMVSGDAENAKKRVSAFINGQLY